MPAIRGALKPDSRDELGGGARRDDDPHRQRQVGDPGLDRRVAQHVLQVERDEEEHREQRHADQQPDDVGAAQGSVSEDRERHQRITLAALNCHERDQQHPGCGQADDRPGRSPADADRVHDGVDEQRQPRGDGDRPGDVERVAGLLAAALAERAGGERGRDQADRDVDEQHPAPAQPAGQDPAEQHSGGAAGAGHRAPDAERAVALGPVGERGGDDRQRSGRLAQRILRESGFVKVEVTGRSGDGGIDGVGVLRLALLSFQVYFQCKRYKGSVSPGAIRDFRGAMVGRTDKGLFITTGTFTAEAKKEATRDGAPAIDLIDGDYLCDLLKSLKLGVTTRMVEEVSIDPSWFAKI